MQHLFFFVSSFLLPVKFIFSAAWSSSCWSSSDSLELSRLILNLCFRTDGLWWSTAVVCFTLFKNTLCLSMHQQCFKLQKGFLAVITVVSASDGTPYWLSDANCMRKWLVVGQNDKLQFWLVLNNTLLKIKVPNRGFLQQGNGRTVLGSPKNLLVNIS